MPTDGAAQAAPFFWGPEEAPGNLGTGGSRIHSLPASASSGFMGAKLTL